MELIVIIFQSFLRGRFFRSGRPMNDEGSISMAARELGHVRQSHPVSRLRYGFLCLVIVSPLLLLFLDFAYWILLHTLEN
jgi:hypothetical protein